MAQAAERLDVVQRTGGVVGRGRWRPGRSARRWPPRRRRARRSGRRPRAPRPAPPLAARAPATDARSSGSRGRWSPPAGAQRRRRPSRRPGDGPAWPRSPRWIGSSAEATTESAELTFGAREISSPATPRIAPKSARSSSSSPSHRRYQARAPSSSQSARNASSRRRERSRSGAERAGVQVDRRVEQGELGAIGEQLRVTGVRRCHRTSRIAGHLSSIRCGINASADRSAMAQADVPGVAAVHSRRP